MRSCGTPGCELPDFHEGPCETAVVSIGEKRKAEPPARHEPTDFKLHKPKNKFQLGADALKVLLRNNIGVTVTAHTKFLVGEWTDSAGQFYQFDAKVVGYEQPKPDTILLLAECKEGVVCELTPEILLNSETHVQWNTPPHGFLSNHILEILNSKENAESLRRAGEFAYIYTQYCRSSPDDIIITLDGNGENRMGMQRRLTELGISEEEWPTILTFEVDAKVALAQRLLFGSSVMYTNADTAFLGSRIQKGKTLLEDVIIGTNRLLTNEMKARVKAVYFDYCGGPPLNSKPTECRQNFASKIFPKLPNIKLFGLTMSHRRHHNLKETFQQYIAIPPNFSLVETFLDNKKVVCKMYTKSAPAVDAELERTIELPKPRNKIKCSLCGESGHSKRTCRVVDVSDTPSSASESEARQGAIVLSHNGSGNEKEYEPLVELKRLFDKGLIPKAIYESRMVNVLNKMGL